MENLFEKGTKKPLYKTATSCNGKGRKRVRSSSGVKKVNNSFLSCWRSDQILVSIPLSGKCVGHEKVISAVDLLDAAVEGDMCLPD